MRRSRASSMKPSTTPTSRGNSVVRRSRCRAMSIRAIAAHSFWYIDPDIGSPLHSSYVGTKVPRACCGLLSLDVKLLRLGFLLGLEAAPDRALAAKHGAVYC